MTVVLVALTLDGLLDRLPPVVDVIDASDEPFLKDATELTESVVFAPEAAFGGWGNEAMLTIFRTVFSGGDPLALPSDEADRRVGTSDVETGN
jgi:hypothetical protein